MPAVVLTMGGFGAYGKIPALGDFFRLGLSQAIVAPWDGWLQATMGAARAALGPRWEPCYMTAPVWRFTLAPGLVGPETLLGVLMPSVDRVGRLFPLTLAAPVGEGPAGPLHGAAEDAFAPLETLARAMLEDGAGREALAEGLAAIAPPATAPRPRLTEAPGLRAFHAPGLASGWGALGAAQAAAGIARPSYWSCALEDGARHLVAEGLPGASAAAALFDATAALWPAEPAELPA